MKVISYFKVIWSDFYLEVSARLYSDLDDLKQIVAFCKFGDFLPLRQAILAAFLSCGVE